MPNVCAYGCGEEFIPLSRGRQTAKGHKACYDRVRKAQSAAAASPLLVDLTQPGGGYANPAKPKEPEHKHPKGWEPRVEVDGDSGIIVTGVSLNADPERDALLKGSDLDPSEWEIVGDLGFNKYQGMFPVEANSTDCKCEERQTVKHHEARWMYQHRARLRRFCPKKRAENERLIEEIRTHVPIPFAPPSGEDGFVVAIADTQMGKSDGDGSDGTMRRILTRIDSVEERIISLRGLGRSLGSLYVFGMGDLIEQCGGHYPQQAFRADLNRREQVTVMRRLIVKALERWAPLFERVVVSAIGGNHGENRQDGKSFTDFADNDDVAIFEQVQEILDANRAAYGHVAFRIPKDELCLTHDIAGEIVGQTHGHVTGKGGATHPGKKVIDWWAKQAHGRQPIGEARILFSGHYHHLLVTESGSKTHFQCPALDGGSDWWRNLSGQDARPGMLTVRIGKNVSESGWSDLEVL